MDRKEFISLVGGGSASAFLLACIGCSKGSNGGSVGGPSSIDFTLDLNSSTNSALLINGGYLAQQGVLVARTITGAYIAVQQSCTHQNYPLVYDMSNDVFYCNNHGSAFSEKGVVLNSPASRNLTVYNTTLNGTSLRVYS
ncbi:MAG: ubiquinol-cytochrome c reductase iron-sulfur subunit [Ginsengibacter sp.]